MNLEREKEVANVLLEELSFEWLGIMALGDVNLPCTRIKIKIVI